MLSNFPQGYMANKWQSLGCKPRQIDSEPMVVFTTKLLPMHPLTRQQRELQRGEFSTYSIPHHWRHASIGWASTWLHTPGSHGRKSVFKALSPAPWMLLCPQLTPFFCPFVIMNSSPDFPPYCLHFYYSIHHTALEKIVFFCLQKVLQTESSSQTCVFGTATVLYNEQMGQAPPVCHNPPCSLLSYPCRVTHL